MIKTSMLLNILAGTVKLAMCFLFLTCSAIFAFCLVEMQKISIMPIPFWLWTGTLVLCTLFMFAAAGYCAFGAFDDFFLHPQDPRRITGKSQTRH